MPGDRHFSDEAYTIQCSHTDDEETGVELLLVDNVITDLHGLRCYGRRCGLVNRVDPQAKTSKLTVFVDSCETSDQESESDKQERVGEPGSGRYGISLCRDAVCASSRTYKA